MKQAQTKTARENSNFVFPSQKHRGLLCVPLNLRILILAFVVTGHFAFGQGFATNTYTVSTDDFANPERGFYFQADSYASAPSSVPANLASYRVNGRNSPGNTYTAKISLLLRLFYLDSFVNAVFLDQHHRGKQPAVPAKERDSEEADRGSDDHTEDGAGHQHVR